MNIGGRRVDLAAELATVGMTYVIDHGRHYARATCGCGAHKDFHMLNGAMTPDMAANHARKAGWFEDRGIIARCPACPHRKKDHSNKERMEEAMKPTTNGSMDALTPAQKGVLRQHMDSHFDDSKGMYLDKWSDEAVSAATKINRATVIEFRERCYGPLAKDGQLSELAGKLEEVRELAKRLHEGINNIDGAIVSIEQRLKDAARNLGVGL